MQEFEDNARRFLEQFKPPDERLDEQPRLESCLKVNYGTLYANGVRLTGLRDVTLDAIDYTADTDPDMETYWRTGTIQFPTMPLTVASYDGVDIEFSNDNARRIRELEAEIQRLIDERGDRT